MILLLFIMTNKTLFFLKAMEGDFTDPSFGLHSTAYNYPPENMMDYSHSPVDYHPGPYDMSMDPSLQPPGHHPGAGGTWYDTDL